MKTENLVILFTDIVGYTESTSKLSREENETLLATHNNLLYPVVKRFGGRIVKTIGDALLLVFRSPTDAMLCAMAMQDCLFAHNQPLPEDKQLHIRVAASLGEVRLENNDIFGEPVNITSRIENITPKDEIYLSDAVFMAMSKAEVPCVEVGLKQLKGITDPVRIWQIPRFSQPRLVAENVMGNKDIAGLAFPYGGAHLKGHPGLDQPRFAGRAPQIVGVGLVAVGVLVAVIWLMVGRKAVNVARHEGAATAPAVEATAPPPPSRPSEPAAPATAGHVPSSAPAPARTEEARPAPAPVRMAESPPPAPTRAAEPPPPAPAAAEPTVPARPQPARATAAEQLAVGLRSTNADRKRDAAKTVFRKHGKDPYLLEVANEELLGGYKVRGEDRDHVDAMSWLCNILGNSADRRYAQTLKTVAAGATSSKLRRYAEKNLKNLN